MNEHPTTIPASLFPGLLDAGDVLRLPPTTLAACLRALPVTP